MPVVEIIVDGVPGVGKTTLIEKIYQEVKDQGTKDKKIQILVNGAFRQEMRDEFVLEEPVDGSLSFIQKRYHPDHFHKETSITDIFLIHEGAATMYRKDMKWIENKFDKGTTVVNIKERDGPSSAIIFYKTTYDDIVKTKDVSHRQLSYMPTWNDIQGKTLPFLKEWVLYMSDRQVQKHFIYMQSSPEFAFKRILRRGREYESAWFNMELMSELANAYDFFYNENSTLNQILDQTFNDIYPTDLATKTIFNVESETFPNNIVTYVKKIITSI